MLRFSKYMTATDLISICDFLEGEKIGEPGTYNSLWARLRNLFGMDFALSSEEDKQQLINDINNMMYIDNDNKLRYKEF
ncbi:MAG: hypothetical protein MJH09_02000 [Cetobacterium sp.]|nr:hypothetical protein [Cetobacterium sp.]